MAEMSTRDEVRGVVRTAMFIHAGLIAGVLIFLAVVLVMNRTRGPISAGKPSTTSGSDLDIKPKTPIIAYSAGAAAAMAVIMALLLVPLIDGAARKAAGVDAAGERRIEPATRAGAAESAMRGSSASGRWAEQTNGAGSTLHDAFLARALLTKTIIMGALLEGAALFNCVAYMLEGRLLSLAATGVLVMGMALMFPTEDRARRWIERQGRVMGRGL